MRLAVMLALACLSGCSLLNKPELPRQPEAPVGGNMAKVGDQIDKSDSRVSAAIAVASENLPDKPGVAKAELGVAAAFLPPAQPGDLAIARARAAAHDEKEYGAARDFGKKLLAQIDANWSKMEADQAEAHRISQLKDAKIVQLTDEIARLKAEGPRNMVLASSGVCFVAALIMGLIGQYVRSGVAFAIGTLLAALPFLFDFKWFLPSLGGLLLVAVVAELFVIFKPKPSAAAADDEQAPKV